MDLENDVIIKIRDLSYKYPNSKEFALKNINLDVKRGDFLVIAGQSGSGKSTLMYCLNGIIPHAISGTLLGSVNICGFDTRKTRIPVLATKIGMVFQNPEAQLFNVTVEDELAFIAENLCFPREKIVEIVDFALKAVGIEDLRERYPFELSGGEKQKVAIASAISVKPDILILDEPTTDLDSKGRTMVLKVLEKLNKMGVTIIIVEHDFDDIIQYINRMILLEGGKLVMDDNPRNVFLSQALKDVGLRPPQAIEIILKLNNKIDFGDFPLIVSNLLPFFQNHLERIEVRQNFESDFLTTQKIPIIEIKNLYFAYGDNMVLKDINLIMNRGEFIGLIGANGSGKTTLAMLLVKLLKPKKGNIKIEGVNLKKIKKITQKVGLLLQNPDYQLFCDTVESEIAYGLKKNEIGLVDVILKEMDLEKFRKKHPQIISRGERQRVATASVVVMQPDILILDEPTSGLDWNHIKKFLDLVSDWNAKGKTIILITHDMRVVAEYCHRVIAMSNGSIILDENTRKAFSMPEILEKAHLKPPPISELTLKAEVNPPLIKVEELS
ncbi:MAG: ABC transporter ATP-binding protein [Candidatus Helarchaeota archaeon]